MEAAPEMAEAVNDEIDNNAAERSLRAVRLGWKNDLFAGSNSGSWGYQGFDSRGAVARLYHVGTKIKGLAERARDSNPRYRC